MIFNIREDKLYEKIKKADSGDLEAQYMVACHIFDEMDQGERDEGLIERALDYLNNVAINGGHYGLAAAKLGDLFFKGRHVPQDYKKAVVWFRTAIQANVPHTYYKLGECFYYGLGMEQNFAKAFDSFMKGTIGADMNQIMLGDMYRKGEFVECDEAVAFEVYKRAFDDASNAFKDAFLLSNAHGLLALRLGECYLHGKGVKCEVCEANKYFEQARMHYEGPYWSKPFDFETETLRLIELMQGAPYPEEEVEATVCNDNDPNGSSPVESNIVDLTNGDISKYSTEDFLAAYFSSVRYLLTNGSNLLVFFKNMVTTYPHLPCFEYDQIFLNRCQRKIESLSKEENDIDKPGG